MFHLILTKFKLPQVATGSQIGQCGSRRCCHSSRSCCQSTRSTFLVEVQFSFSFRQLFQQYLPSFQGRKLSTCPFTQPGQCSEGGIYGFPYAVCVPFLHACFIFLPPQSSPKSRMGCWPSTKGIEQYEGQIVQKK